MKEKDETQTVVPNWIGGGGEKISAKVLPSAAADQNFIGGGGEKSAANMSNRMEIFSHFHLTVVTFLLEHAKQNDVLHQYH